jgi:hypothetical protein
VTFSEIGGCFEPNIQRRQRCSRSKLARSDRYYIDIAGYRVIAVAQICCKLRVNSESVLRFAPNGLRAFATSGISSRPGSEEKARCYSWETGSSLRADGALPSA